MTLSAGDLGVERVIGDELGARPLS